MADDSAEASVFSNRVTCILFILGHLQNEILLG